jgi:hypothetical protein
MSKEPTFIKVTESGQIEYAYHCYHSQFGELWSIRVPAYGIALTAPSKEEGLKRAAIAIRSFYNMWINNDGWVKFIHEIHKLGFRANKHDMVMAKLLKRQPFEAKFKTTVIEEGEGEFVIDKIAA